eukprot:jgi/Bigna1/132329/aug1.17_g7037
MSASTTADPSSLLHLGVLRISSDHDFELVVRWQKQPNEDFDAKCERILGKLVQRQDTKKLWSFDAKQLNYTIHVNVRPKQQDNCAFFVITKSGYDRSIKGLLNDFADGFSSTVTRKEVNESNYRGLNKKCASLFESLDEKYGTDKLMKVKGQVDQLHDKTKEIMMDIIDREGDLNRLDTEADGLANEAKGFEQTSNKLKWKFCRENAKWTIILTLSIITILIVIIVAAVCVNDPDACNS